MLTSAMPIMQDPICGGVTGLPGGLVGGGGGGGSWLPWHPYLLTWQHDQSGINSPLPVASCFSSPSPPCTTHPYIYSLFHSSQRCSPSTSNDSFVCIKY